MDDAKIKQLVAQQIQASLDHYLHDLESMDESLLRSSPGGTARSPYDFTYEVIYVNNRAHSRLIGVDPGPFHSEGWMRAPEEYQSKGVLIAQLRESAEKVLAAWNALPLSDLDKVIQLASGETSMIEVANLCASHMNYHDAQLNYLQTLMGDDELHWN